jgi:glutamine amidotransferase
LLEPEHGLIVQSYAPRRQAHGRMNAEGWGAGFFAASRPEPARRRSSRPLWAVASSASVTRVVASSSYVLAAVRSACDSAQLAAHHLVDVADGVVTITELEA